MPYSRVALAVALAAALVGVPLRIFTRESAAPDAAQRLDELRRLARPAEERLAQGREADELRAELSALDRQLRELAPLDEAPPVQALHGSLVSGELDPYRAWTARAFPALAPWLRSELCGNAPIPLRERVAAHWRQDRRIAAGPPRLASVRTWGNLMAWHAFLESQRGADAREPWELGPAEILAAIFPLAYACDDASLIGTMVRIHVEDQTLRAGRVLLERGALTPSALRAAFEPWLARSAAFEPREMIEGELRAFLVLFDGVATSDEEAGRPALEFYASVDEAVELAALSAAELMEATRTASRDRPVGIAGTSLSALAVVHRHRSILAVSRVTLAILEHRERTGALPASLDDLAGVFSDGLPRDPLTDAPLPYRFEHGRARLGPVACPTHGSDACRDVDWTAAVEQMLAWDSSAER